MKFSRVLTAMSVSMLSYFSFCAFADEEYVVGFSSSGSNWFKAGASIQDLRERSTNWFNLLDENQSGSITLDEIDLTEMESETEQMDPEELRQYRRRSSVIHSKFMSWSSEIDEFEVVDANGDGVWNKDEFEARNANMQRHRLELGIQEWDTDGNGAVELHEFNSHLDELELLDENADGKVSHQEAFKSKDKNVMSDVLMKMLQVEEAIYTTRVRETARLKAAAADSRAQATETRYRIIERKKADNSDK